MLQRVKSHMRDILLTNRREHLKSSCKFNQISQLNQKGQMMKLIRFHLNQATLNYRKHLVLCSLLIGFALMVVESGCDNSKPEMPVSITYRNSSVGIGYVVQFHNTSNKYLGIRAVFKNSTMNQSMEKQFNLDPFGTQEFGWTDGWEFVSGETITVYESDYQTLNVRIP